VSFALGSWCLEPLSRGLPPWAGDCALWAAVVRDGRGVSRQGAPLGTAVPAGWVSSAAGSFREGTF